MTSHINFCIVIVTQQQIKLIQIMLRRYREEQVVGTQTMQKMIQNFNIEQFSCDKFHPNITCNEKMIFQLFATSQSMSKMYLFAHLVPFILFRRKKFKKQPTAELKKLLIGFVKSLLFSAGFYTISKRLDCFFNQHGRNLTFPQALCTSIAGITLIFEPIGRQTEITLYALNKAMEVTYNMALYRNLPVRLPFGECLLNSAALSMLCYHYFNNAQAIRQNYLKFMNNFLSKI